MTRKPIFSEGRTLCARFIRPPTNAKAFHYGQGVGRIAGRLLVTCLASARALLPGVRSPPLQGSQPNTDALAGETRDNAGGGFLGGTRSARPDAEAVIKPRHNRIIGAKRTPGGLEGTRLGQAQAIPAGLQSPPLRDAA